jgi:nucleotide-binding universal stress UspA family protein
MKNNKYKILILSDLKKSTDVTLKSAVSLAKMINADISLFYVKKPTDVVERESQLSAYRTINEQHSLTKNKIENLIDPACKSYGIKIDYSYKFGNIKKEISEHINTHNPDIIVLGKKNNNIISFIGDSVTDFVLKTHKGMIMIAGNENNLEPNQKLSLGFLNNNSEMVTEFEKSILANSQKPLKTFRFVKNNDTPRKSETIIGVNTVDFVFERNDNAINNLSNYLSKNNINLLYMNNGNLLKTEIKEFMNKLNVSLLLSGNPI